MGLAGIKCSESRKRVSRNTGDFRRFLPVLSGNLVIRRRSIYQVWAMFKTENPPRYRVFRNGCSLVRMKASRMYGLTAYKPYKPYKPQNPIHPINPHKTP